MSVPAARLSKLNSPAHQYQDTRGNRQHIEQAARITAASSQSACLPFANIGQPTNAFAVKRTLDFVAASLLVVLLSPLLVFLALVLKLSEGGPVLFTQKRVGFKGTTFRCLKFRTMVVGAEQVLQAHLAEDHDAKREWKETQKLRNDPRVTPLGRWLRKTSLDELPQLFNVLAGHMSFVGPRPIIEDEVVRYGDRIREYISVRPGITGLWQVSGRSHCTYEERVEFDTRYAKECGLLVDISILLRTIPAILRQEGSC